MLFYTDVFSKNILKSYVTLFLLFEGLGSLPNGNIWILFKILNSFNIFFYNYKY